jgi:hypothetical protein
VTTISCSEAAACAWAELDEARKSKHAHPISGTSCGAPLQEKYSVAIMRPDHYKIVMLGKINFSL